MINWNSLLLVAAVAIGATVAVVAVFSLGMRFLTDARHIRSEGKKKDVAKPGEIIFRTAAYAMFTLCSMALIYGIYLIVPYFHLAK